MSLLNKRSTRSVGRGFWKKQGVLYSALFAFVVTLIASDFAVLKTAILRIDEVASVPSRSILCTIMKTRDNQGILNASASNLRNASPGAPLHPMCMETKLAISVLDLVGMRPGESAGSAIARSVQLAKHVEKLGYMRYWLAEHHSIAGLACSATSILIGHLAAATETIRVGSGGVMLPNHAPLVVAEEFGTLEALYPGRIDLGLGRAPGGDFATMRALRRDMSQGGEDFPALLQELQTYLGPEERQQIVKAIPGQGSQVPITLLGSGLFSAQLAARLGLPFAFAAHFAPAHIFRATEQYRREFRPSETLREPYLMVAVQVIVAETDAAAQRLFTTSQQRFLQLIRNGPVELLPPVDSMEALWEDWERTAVEEKLAAAIVGSDATVRAGLERLVQGTGANEVIAVTDTYDPQARLESYRRLAELLAD